MSQEQFKKVCKNPCQANETLFQICQQYDRQENKHFDIDNEGDPILDKNESTTKSKEDVLDTPYCLDQTDNVSPENFKIEQLTFTPYQLHRYVHNGELHSSTE